MRVERIYLSHRITGRTHAVQNIVRDSGAADVAERTAEAPGDDAVSAFQLPMEADPRKLFERLFGKGDTPQERKAIAKQYASILDLVTEEAADLQRRLDAQDRSRLGDYLESVREIERRVQKMEERDLSKLDLPEFPSVPLSTSV